MVHQVVLIYLIAMRNARTSSKALNFAYHILPCQRRIGPNVHERSCARISKASVESELADVEVTEGRRLYYSLSIFVEIGRLVVQQKDIATINEHIIKWVARKIKARMCLPVGIRASLRTRVDRPAKSRCCVSQSHVVPEHEIGA